VWNLSRFRPAIVLLLCLGLGAGLATLAGAAEPAPARAGLVVEQVRRGSTGDRAGLQEGDLLLSWSRETGGEPARGTLRSTFDWRGLLIEQVPRGTVAIAGLRGATPWIWVLPAGAPSGGERTAEEVALRPLLNGDLLARYAAGRERIAAGEIEPGVEIWRSAAALARSQGDADLALWFELRQAQASAEAERWLEADALYEALIEPREAAGPAAGPEPALQAVQLLREWGRLWSQRRILDRAGDCYQRALALARQLAPESLTVAWSLTDLGDLATRGGGAQDPDSFFLQALAIRQRLAPGSSDLASSWRNLGSEALTDGDPRRAEEDFRKALELQEKATPGQIYVAERLLAVAAARYFQKDYPASEKLYEQARAIFEREAPEDRGLLGILQGIGAAASERGDWRKAEAALQSAVQLGDRLGPASVDQMHLLLYDLGLAQRRLGKREAGTASLCRSVQLVEQRRRHLASNQEIQLSWSFRYSEQYQACAQGLIDLGRTREAFEALERGRARSFLHLLTERDLRFSELPPVQAARWKQLTADYEATQGLLEQARAGKAEQRRIWSLEGRLREIRRGKERILAENLPLSLLHYPEPLGLDGVRRTLDRGTVLLFYAVGEERTLLFAVKPADQGAAGLATFRLPVKGTDLKAEVETFRQTLIGDRLNAESLRVQGGRLYAELVRPAEAFLAGSQRLLIVPDGPLHTLPFAALRRQDQYLIEWKPLHFAVSVTALSELQKRRRPGEGRAGRQLVAFGDPLPAPPPAYPPLPESRAEVEGIARLVPGTRLFLGKDATEENARRLGGDARWLHFAVHGLLNARMPTHSGLVLSPPSGDSKEPGNGLLQAWEIMEDLRLDADLVTLSACDTALGTEVGGEGLIGLTRAFQYAGARSVLATLWGVSDRSTAPWMRRFYRELRDGKSKDEAVRAAQMEQIRSRDGPYPFYWAAFQLYGDWR
jgi:CHAT domain-containing protein